MGEFALVGDPIDEIKRPAVFEFRLEDHLNSIDPESFKLKPDVPSLKPSDYFITSGDAVLKAEKLEKDLWSLAHRLRNNRPKRVTKKYMAYEKAVWSCARNSREMVKKLKEARGDACFLETEWRDRALLVIPKNPRTKKP